MYRAVVAQGGICYLLVQAFSGLVQLQGSGHLVIKAFESTCPQSIPGCPCAKTCIQAVGKCLASPYRRFEPEEGTVSSPGIHAPRRSTFKACPSLLRIGGGGGDEDYVAPSVFAPSKFAPVKS